MRHSRFTMKFVVTTLALLAFVVWNEAFNNPPAPGPPSIYDLLTCIGPPIRNQSMENFPLVSLVPVPPGETWDPPNSTAPLYYENYDTIFNDVGLQNRLIQHIGEERYRNFTESVTHIGPDTDGIPVPSGDQLLLGPGCQGDPLVTDRYPNVTTTSAITTSFLNQIECGATFSWGNRIPFFFPPHLTHIQCNNALNTFCSIPIGPAFCAINVTCNYNTPMLMWDCCWTWDASTSAFVYDCGWRNVLVPIATGCLCSC